MGQEQHLRYAYRSPESDETIELSLSAEDAAKFERGYRWGPHEMTDHNSGAVVSVQGAECGAGPRCFCAAEIVEVITPGAGALKVSR